MALGEKIQVGAYAKKLSETVLREARSEHDLLISGAKKRDAPSTFDAGAGKMASSNEYKQPKQLKCYKCGAYGHVEAQCWKKHRKY